MASSSSLQAWKNLCSWIIGSSQHRHDAVGGGGGGGGGGIVHPALELRPITTTTTTTTTTSGGGGGGGNHRGIFASRDIAPGEILIQLPCRLAIDGSDMPRQYFISTTTEQEPQPRHASPWLRCLAAYYQARQQQQQQQQEEGPNNNNPKNKQPYLDTLPQQYETVSLSWTPEQIDSFLAGTNCSSAQPAETTTAGGSASSSSLLTPSSSPSPASVWHADRNLLKERYVTQIRPYLEACQILPPSCTTTTAPSTDTKAQQQQVVGNVVEKKVDPVEFQEFLVATQCLSTRCFHVATAAAHTTTGDNQASRTTATVGQDSGSGASTSLDDAYTGPYLLPCIDLLNHSSVTTTSTTTTTTTTQKCTTLQKTPNYFIMQAERPIRAGEEICHSYGNDLTASQCLQTFGFVERSVLEILAHRATPQDDDDDDDDDDAVEEEETAQNDVPNPTPVLLPKQLVLEACWNVIESGLPERLAQAMKEAGMQDDVWTVQIDRSRCAEFLPDQILVPRPGATFSNNNNIGPQALVLDSLSDELVTLACVPFLPLSEYREASQALIGKEILHDYFLGNLVCTSLLNAIKERLVLYKPIVWNGTVRDDDRQLLQELLAASASASAATTADESYDSWLQRERCMYGLAVRLDEKASLQSLRKQVLQLLEDLDSTNDEEDDDEQEEEGDETTPNKRYKMA
ncbi:hypothetical protein ACA910_006010 [Epithemia clementina (nom. ined.)]